jgi:hypothetical protein
METAEEAAKRIDKKLEFGVTAKKYENALLQDESQWIPIIIAMEIAILILLVAIWL